MTSLSTIGTDHQHIEGRTVRDVVEYSPGQVNEVWCRKIFRQVLQSLELQYAMRMPHRPITPDTIVFHDNGEPLLIPTEGAPLEGSVADDLAALARVVHYAVTRELAPTGPLAGRADLGGYSASLKAAVDRCMAPDPAARPQTIEALRELLGIVPPGPAAKAMPADVLAAPASTEPAHADPAHAEPAPSDPAHSDPAHSAPVFAESIPAAPPSAPVPVTPAAMPHKDAPPAPRADRPAATAAASSPLPGISSSLPDPALAAMIAPGRPRLGAGLSRWQRWAIAAGGGAVLVAVALALIAELRDSGSFDRVVLTLPQADDGAATTPQPAAAAATAATDAASTAATVAPSAAAPAQEAPAAGIPRGAAPAPGFVADPGHRQGAASASGVAGGAAYKLLIQPWGVVYVDGVDRGVSPPVKRLDLAPGKHSIRVSNPNFHDRELTVDTSEGDGTITVDFGAPTPPPPPQGEQ